MTFNAKELIRAELYKFTSLIIFLHKIHTG